MPAQERRAHLIEATLQVLRDKGQSATVRDIAEAAGVAEGTLFRVFASKDELIDAALREAFDHTDFLTRLEQVSPGLPLREHLLQVVALLQAQFTQTLDLMQAMGMVAIPEELLGDPDTRQRGHRRAEELLHGLAESYADQLRISPWLLGHVLRLLTFAGSHPKLTQGRRLTPEEIVDLILLGALADPGQAR